ncbi:MAG: hypothetical protein DME83_05335 [Verrucomicrobia bacterium]|nr:MAG: hypothetical protein DME83_05335 [Verrucomicrobiota bacterium]
MPSDLEATNWPGPLFDSVQECLKKQTVFLPMSRTLGPGPYNELPSMATCVGSSEETGLFEILTAVIGLVPRPFK